MDDTIEVDVIEEGSWNLVSLLIDRNDPSVLRLIEASSMEEMPVAITTPTNLLRLILRCAVIGFEISAVTLIFLLISETKNEISVINQTSMPTRFELECVNQFRTADDQLPTYEVMFADQTIPPHSSVSRSFRLPERKSLVLADIRKTKRGPLRRYRQLPKWGNRITIIEGDKRVSTCEVTTLRQWFDKNRTWLEDHRRWIPLTKGWWQ